MNECIVASSKESNTVLDKVNKDDIGLRLNTKFLSINNDIKDDKLNCKLEKKEIFETFNLSTELYFENLLKKLKKEASNNFQNLFKSNKSVISELRNIPDEAFLIYQVDRKDSIFNLNNVNKNFETSESNVNIHEEENETPYNQSKSYTTFMKLHQLVIKYSMHDSFEKIYHNFKPYIKFLIQNLENLSNLKPIERIFIIDDNNIVLKSLKNIITDIAKEKNEKPKILESYDGIEGLALYKIDYLLNKSIKLIISDQNMTMMNGLEMLNIIRKFPFSEGKPQLYICSADKFDIQSQDILFLNKPIDKTNLRKII